MAYAVVTPSEFKTAKPQFSSVTDETVQSYLDLAGVIGADQGWSEALYSHAIIAMTCHLMTLDGLGSDEQSKAYANGTAMYQTVKSADLTLTRFQASAGKSTYQDWLSQTPCGQFYAVLLARAKGGPRILMGGPACGASPYAKDGSGPVYGWPGVFFA